MKTKKILLIIIVLILVLVAGNFLTPYDPNEMKVEQRLQSPSYAHILGTDNLGRDIFSRILQGAGATLLIAICTVALGLSVGLVIGGITGYFGGILDELLMRINDSILAFPNILLALVIIAIIGPGKYNIIIALSIIFIPSFAYITRTEVARQKNTDYVRNARLMGASNARILFVHIFPNILPVLLSTMTISFNNAVLAEASMSFLGVGVQPPDPSLGRMLSESQSFLSRAPWYALSTGCAIIVLILSFTILSNELKGSADAYSK